jgi:hypothetical protein
MLNIPIWFQLFLFVRLGIPFGGAVLHVFGSRDPVIQCLREIDLI